MHKNLAATITGALVSLSLIGCGSSLSSTGAASATQVVGIAGGTIQAGQSVVSIPQGALTAPTQVTVREAEPHHAGRAHRVEIEPSGASLAVPAQVSVQIDDSNARVKMHDGSDDLLDVEVEDRNHGMFKTSMSQLGAVEVELEHGTACSPACGAGQECDDGVCKPHSEDASAQTCTPVCGTGEECDDGACKTHLEVEMHHGVTTATGGVPTVAAICSPACGTGLECDNGVCKAHGGKH